MAYNLKYYFEFGDGFGNEYRTEIAELNFVGEAMEIEAGENPVIHEYPSVSDKLKAIRGSSLQLNLLASLDFTLEDLGSERERQFLVTHAIKDGFNYNVLFKGFILPDGIEQSFVNDKWEMRIDAVDGLGLLKNLAFVDNDTKQLFTGLMNAKDVIYNCLRRIGLGLRMNTAVNIFPVEITMTTGIDALEIANFQCERYVKDLNTSEPKNCEEVLTSVLEMFNASVCQQYGEWFIYRANELALDATDVEFFQYGTNGLMDTPNTKNYTLTASLGSDINGAYPHHVNENQIIRFEQAYKSFRVNYKFGFLKSLVENQNFANWTSGLPDGFHREGAVPVTQTSQGILFTDRYAISSPQNNYLANNPIAALTGERFRVEISIKAPNISPDMGRAYQLWYSIWVDSYSFDYINGIWETGSTNLTPSNGVKIGQTYQFAIELPGAPTNGNLEVRMHGGRPKNAGGSENDEWIEVTRFNIVPIASDNGAQGEFHNADQPYDYSYVPDNKVVYNGDNQYSSIYSGAICFSNGVTTGRWYRKGVSESRPILEIMVSDILRMYQRQYKTFIGDYMGWIDYLSLVSISSLSGVFMPGKLDFNYAKNTGNIELIEVMGGEIPDLGELKGIMYSWIDDFGDPIKPTIR